MIFAKPESHSSKNNFSKQSQERTSKAKAGNCKTEKAIDKVKTKTTKSLVRLLLALLITLSLVEPLDELLSALAHLAAGRQVDVLLAGLGTPGLESFLRDEVVLVDLEQDARDLADKFRVVVSDKALKTTEEGLLVLLRRDQLLEHGRARGDLLDNASSEDGLGKDSGCAVLGLDAELLSLEIDVGVGNLVDVALLLGGVVNPLAELVVNAFLLSLTILSLVIEGERVLEVIGKGLSASLNGLFRHVDGPGDC
jgi:hypothetical protein